MVNLDEWRIDMPENQTVVDEDDEKETPELVEASEDLELKSEPDGMEFIAEQFNLLNRRIENLEGEFSGKLKYDRHKERIIDNLHKELQEYRNDLIRNLMQPVIMDVIRVIEDMKKLIVHHESKETSELNPEKLLKLLQSFPGDLEDLLFKLRVEPFQDDGAPFNPSRQKAARTIETDDKARDKTICRSVRNGYEWDGKVLLPELVEVYTYKAQDAEVAKEKNEENE